MAIGEEEEKTTVVSSCILNVGEMQWMHFFPRCKYVLSAQQHFLHEWHLARHAIIINICQGKYGGLGGVGMEKIPCIFWHFSKHNDLSGQHCSFFEPRYFYNLALAFNTKNFCRRRQAFINETKRRVYRNISNARLNIWTVMPTSNCGGNVQFKIVLKKYLYFYAAGFH